MCLNLRDNIFPKFEILKPFAYNLYVLEQKPSAYSFVPFEIYPKTLSFLKSDQWFKFRNDQHGFFLVRRYGIIKFLKQVRSLAFWQQKQRELMSMIIQLGCPTFFLTLSAAETKWLELLRILKQILDDVKLSVEEVLEFQWSERADLIRRDPVTYARYFDHRSKELFKWPENARK